MAAAPVEAEEEVGRREGERVGRREVGQEVKRMRVVMRGRGAIDGFSLSLGFVITGGFC